ncbi:hypothetical protein AB0K21_26075 [Streptosporangium sp. NPDC049248]|uniref:hypothetical protein n=1 Tax=Streptosporangium sp. NPDC049248 TaxID=3155651 RepID=UPI00341B34D9
MAMIASIVSVSFVLTAANPAQAVARLNVPSRVTSNSTVVISGRVDLLFDAVLFVNGRQVAKGDQKVSYAWNPRHHRNGRYRIRLEQRGKVLGAEWHQTGKTLVQAVPPATPSGVSARLYGKRVVVRWSRGAEPDLQGYVISTSRTGRVGSVRVGSACSGGSCRATLAVPAKAAGQRIGFTVRALRGNGGGGTLSSGNSAGASVKVPAATVAKSGRKTGGQESSGTRSGSNQSDTGSRRNTEKSGKKSENKQAGVHDLPQLPAKKPTGASNRPSGTAVAPTEKPGVSEKAENGGDATSSIAEPAEKTNEGAGGDREKKEGAGSAPDPGATGADSAPNTNSTAGSSDVPAGGMSQYGFFIAGALVLLLLGAHGGAWIRRRLLAAADGSAGGDRHRAGGGDGQTVPLASEPLGGRDAKGDAKTTGRGGTADRNGTTGTGGRGGVAGKGGTAVTVDPRRPAVILAVVKTGLAPGSPSPDSRASGRPHPPRQSPDRPASDRPASDRPVPDRPASDRPVPDRHVSAEPAPARRVPAQRISIRDAPVQPISVLPASVRLASVRKVTDRETEAQQARPRQAEAEHAETEHAETEHAGFERAEAEHTETGYAETRYAETGQAGHAGRPGADPAPGATPLSEAGDAEQAAARTADRWDDYLPPAPRSLEDSGFWARPQPGATDFWAEDRNDEDRSDEDRDGRRERDGLSSSGHRFIPGMS